MTCFSSVHWYFFIARSEKKQEDLYFGKVVLNLVFPKPTTEFMTSLRRLYGIGDTDIHSWYCDNSEDMGFRWCDIMNTQTEIGDG